MKNILWNWVQHPKYGKLCISLQKTKSENQAFFETQGFICYYTALSG